MGYLAFTFRRLSEERQSEVLESANQTWNDIASDPIAALSSLIDLVFDEQGIKFILLIVLFKLLSRMFTKRAECAKLSEPAACGEHTT